ncbi:MAG: PTS sugar transporter subunit IIC [Endomicrobiales bacterium]|nr:PTS sugar transporter subunit IIC [Endomicrobiales bacterium]
MTEILTIALLASIICLDATAVGQFMISRPIVCATIFGFLKGDPLTGLWVGVIAELIWVSSLPMGAAVPIDTTAVSILTVVWSLTTFPVQKGTIILALLIAVPCGLLFTKLDIWIRYLNVFIMRWVEKGIESGKEIRIVQGVVIGLLMFFLKAFVFFAVLIVPGRNIVKHVFPLLPGYVVEGFGVAWYLLPIMGMGFILVNFRDGKFPCRKVGELKNER